ncbi:hypothetical protein [Roseibium polysiphoniae]|uniref:Uncharacterized protein n=1 Tax=Roseibium polysiphoniae TaxID=2571221 RepID=A0ABR9C4Z9_9HYPH|nr:hypothetical protein [Roseibium polysiphoniae]MBD8874953.1 hypothetical protein [Roseibium polysiphoniae]
MRTFSKNDEKSIRMNAPTDATALVALDLKQAQAFKHLHARELTCVAYSPDAANFLKFNGLNTIELENIITTSTHSEILLKSEILINNIENTLSTDGIPSGVVESCRIFLFNYIPALLLLEETLKKIPFSSFAIESRGRILAGISQDAAIGELACHLGDSYLALLPNNRCSKLNSYLCHFSNKIIQRLVLHRPMALQLDRATPFTSKICNTIANSNQNIVIASARPPGKTIASTIRRTLKSVCSIFLSRGRRCEVTLFRAPLPRQSKHLSPLRINPSKEISTAVADAINKGLNRHMANIAQDVIAGQLLARHAKPQVIVIDHLIQPSVYQAAVDFAASGVPALMANHGSDTAQTDRLSKLGAKFWARHGRIILPGLDTLFCKGPLTAKLAKEMHENTPQILPIRIGPKHKSFKKGSDAFLIIMAGNYRELCNYVPFVTETPGEYLRGLLEFSRAASQVDGIRLVIKLKPNKTGLPVEWLNQELKKPEYCGRVEIDTETPLGQLFGTMDLLVGNNSATLQEALDNRIPLLLNTWRRKYFHFPASFVPPTANRRAAVYAVRSAHELGPMLKALRDYHQDRLADEEVCGLVWTPEELATTDEFLRHILDQTPH